MTIPDEFRQKAFAAREEIIRKFNLTEKEMLVLLRAEAAMMSAVQATLEILDGSNIGVDNGKIVAIAVATILAAQNSALSNREMLQ